MKFLPILMTTLALGACTTPPPSGGGETAPPALGSACDTAAIANLVGQPFTPALEADAKARAKVEAVRVIRPGTAVTMDFRPDRLNIDIDDKNVVTGFRCG